MLMMLASVTIPLLLFALSTLHGVVAREDHGHPSKFDMLIPIGQAERGTLVLMTDQPSEHSTALGKMQEVAIVPMVLLDLAFVLRSLTRYKVREENRRASVSEEALLSPDALNLVIPESFERHLITLDSRWAKDVVVWPTNTEIAMAVQLFNLSMIDRPGLVDLGLLSVENSIVIVQEKPGSDLRSLRSVFGSDSLLSKHPAVSYFTATNGPRVEASKYSMTYHKYNVHDERQLLQPNRMWDAVLLNGKQLLPSPSDFNGYQFTATTVPYAYACVTQSQFKKDWGLEGNEELALSLMTSELNLARSFVKTSSGHYGVLNANKRWTGMLGMVHRGTADMAMCTMSWFSLRATTFAPIMFPMGMNVRTFVAPPPQPYPRVLAIISPFRVWVWLAVILTFIAVVPLMRAVAVAEDFIHIESIERRNTNWTSPAGSLLFCIASILNESRLKNSDLGNAPVLKCTVGIWLLVCLVLSNSFGGELRSYLSRPAFTLPLDTMEELMQSDISWAWANEGRAVEQGLKRGAYQGMQIQKLWDSKVDFPSAHSAAGLNLDQTLKGKLAVVELSIELEYVITTKYSTMSGDPLVHLSRGMRELPRPLFWFFPKLNPFSLRIDFLLRLYFDLGILEHLKQHVLRESTLKLMESGETRRSLTNERPNPAPATLSDFYGSFGLVACLLGVALMAFCLEVRQ